MSQIQKAIAEFVAPGKPVGNVTPDVRVEVVSGIVKDIAGNKDNAKNIIISVEGQQYDHSGYIGTNEMVFKLLQKAKELGTPVIVRLERKRKKDEDPSASIMELTKDMDTARKHAVKTTVGIYDENAGQWVLTSEAQSDTTKDPESVTAGIAAANYNPSNFFSAPQQSSDAPVQRVSSSREKSAESDSLLTLYFFVLERFKNAGVKPDNVLIQEYAKILQTSCGFIQSRLFKLEAPVYSDYSFTRARYLLFNYADHISDLDAETLKDVNSFKNWAKRFIKNGEALWGWAITGTTK